MVTCCTYPRQGPSNDAGIVFKIKVNEDDYLGQEASKYRMVWIGMELKINNITSTKKKWLDLVDAIVEKAKGKINIDFTCLCNLKYTNGERAKIIIPDLSFGDIPVNFGGKSENVTKSLTANASRYKRA